MNRKEGFPRLTMTLLVILGLMILLPVAASATNNGETMPWDQGLTVIMNSLSGTTVKIIGVILIIGAGIGIAVSHGAAVKTIAFVIVGLGVALNAASFLSMMYGNASGFELEAVRTSLPHASRTLHALIVGL